MTVSNDIIKFAVLQAESSFKIPYNFQRTKKFLGTLITENGTSYQKYRIDYFEVSVNIKIVYRQVYINFFTDGTFEIEGFINFGNVGEEIE